MADENPLDGETDRPDVACEIVADNTYAKIKTSLLHTDTYFDEDASAGVRLLGDGAMDPMLFVGTETLDGERLTAGATLTPAQARQLGQRLVELADEAEQKRATRPPTDTDDSKSRLARAVASFFSDDGGESE